MASKLSLYNGALTVLGERSLATLADDIEARYVIDSIYDRCIKSCLETSAWVWSLRTVVLDYDTSVTPDFGFTYAFAQPSDLIRLYAMSGDENFSIPLNEFVDEAGYWYAWITPIYARYVSNDAAYGGDLSRYTDSYAEFVEHSLARRICRRLTASEEKFKTLFQLEDKFKKFAIANDGLREPVGFPPYGTWVQSRGRRMGDRTPTSTLIG